LPKKIYNHEAFAFFFDLRQKTTTTTTTTATTKNRQKFSNLNAIFSLQKQHFSLPDKVPAVTMEKYENGKQENEIYIY